MYAVKEKISEKYKIVHLFNIFLDSYVWVFTRESSWKFIQLQCINSGGVEEKD